MSFIAMHVVGVDANIMSLAGIAIAIGTMVDMAIIVSENIYGHLAEWESEREGDKERGRQGEISPSPRLPHAHSTPLAKARADVIYEAAVEVAPAVFTAVMTTIVSFLPVFFLTGRDYRLFSPLAYTKTFAIAAAMITAVTIVPALSRLMLRSSRYSKLTSLATGPSFAALLDPRLTTSGDHRLAGHFATQPWVITTCRHRPCIYCWLASTARANSSD